MKPFVYPPNLYEVLSTRWNTKVHSTEEILPLPSKETFDEIANVMYHASFLLEEGRRIWFRVVYCSLEDLETKRITNALNFHTIIFDKPRNFGVHELLKLAPAVDPTQVLIAVTTLDNKLKIWGLIETGSDWWDFSRHEASSAPSPPNTLNILSRRPGELIVSRSGRIFITLSQGKTAQSSANLLTIMQLRNFFTLGAKKLTTEYFAVATKNNLNFSNQPDLSFMDYVFFIVRLIANIREQRHGGTILMIPDEIGIEDTHLRDILNIKYKCEFEALSAIANERVRNAYWGSY